MGSTCRTCYLLSLKQNEGESVRRRKLDGKLKTCGAVYIGFGCYPVQSWKKGGGYETLLKRQCFKYFTSSYETAVQMTMHVFPTLCFVVSGGRILCIENWKLKTLSSSFFFGPSAVPVSLHQFHKPHKQQISLGEINLKFRPRLNWDLVLLYHTKMYLWLFNRRGFEWNAINFEMIVGRNSNSLNYANASI